MSIYGITELSLSVKNWEIKGALRFIVKGLLLAAACLATSKMLSGLTVRKNPLKKRKELL
jgi:hypothetical protein